MPTIKVHNDFEQWRALVSESFVPLSCELAEHVSGFDASMYTFSHQGLQVSRIAADPHEVHRNPRDLDRGSSSDVKISFVIRGRAIIEQGDSQHVVSAGGSAMYHCDAPYHLIMDGRFEQIVLQLDRREIESHTTVPLGSAITFSRDDLYLRCLRSMVSELTSAEDDVDSKTLEPDVVPGMSTDENDTKSRILRQKVVELVALLVSASTQAPVGSGPTRHQLYLRALEVVSARLSDPDLDPDSIARRINVSRRALYKLFESEGETVNNYIISRRLERAYDQVSDPKVEATITEIAMGLGFQSVSHFSRRFSEAFGVAPTEARRTLARMTDGRPAAGH